MNLADFDYDLPPDRIAQRPLENRDASRMLVVHREARRWEDRSFGDLPEFLRPGDCLVLNDSKVIPSRLYGRRQGVGSLPVGKHNPKRWQNLSGRVEVFLLRPLSADALTWEALVRPGRKMRVGEVIHFGPGLDAEIVDRGDFGERTVRFRCEVDLYERLDALGHVPLPPYIRRSDTPEDRRRYQTVFARERGSVAAPTAGLHFTPEILERCREKGAEVACVTLHIGLGTFQPLHTDVTEEARLHSEAFHISAGSAARIASARRVVAVGTTSVRVLEAAARGDSGETDIFIYPGFTFRVTQALLTNFHLPRSSLLLLVCALGGTELILDAYRHAVASGYRFYSYGDCMLVL
jgi:S-adenosylmethionine:tRNA ribosyltransferase-isomerase